MKPRATQIDAQPDGSYHLYENGKLICRVSFDMLKTAPKMFDLLKTVDTLLRFTQLDPTGETVHDHVKAAIAEAQGR